MTRSLPAAARRRPDLLGLLLVIGLASAGAIVYVLKLEGYFVMPDELTYQREMLAIARTGRPVLPSEPYYVSISQLMPALHAPIWGLASTTTGALNASHVLNGLVFATAAIPVHLLVRRVTASSVAAVAAGAATIAVPWFAMTGTLMTEPVAYTAFAWAILAIHHAVAAPSWRGDLIGLAGVALAVAARAQLVFLLAVLVVALVIREAAGPRVPVREALRRHAVLLAGALLGAVYLLVSGYAPGDALGKYGITTEGQLLPEGSLAYSRELLTSVALACAGITLPLTVGWALGALRRPEHPERFACALVLILAGVASVVVAGSFSVRFTAGQNDRYIEYVAPLLFAGTACALTLGPLGLVPTALATAGSVWIYATSTLQLQGPSLSSPGSAFRTVIDGRSRVLAGWFGIDTEATTVVAVLVGLGVIAVLLVRRRVSAPAVGAVVALGVLAYGVAATAYTMRAVARTQEGASATFLASRGWADRALPDGQQLGAILGLVGDEVTTTGVWWDTVFYNREVERVYTLGNSSSYQQSGVAGATVDEPSGALEGVSAGHLLVPTQPVIFGLRGTRELAQFGGVSLVRTPPRLVADFTLDSENNAGRAARGYPMLLRLYPPGRVRARLSVVARAAALDLDVHSGGRRVARRPLPLDKPVTVELPARTPARLRLGVGPRTPEGAYIQVLGVRVVRG